MSTLEFLKSLESEALPGPWEMHRMGSMTRPKAVHITGKGYSLATTGLDEGQVGKFASSAHSDAALIVALRNIAPELLALWDAARLLDGTKPGGRGILALPDVFKSLEMLDAKASEVLG